jgi:hypothetical protein
MKDKDSQLIWEAITTAKSQVVTSPSSKSTDPNFAAQLIWEAAKTAQAAKAQPPAQQDVERQYR